MQESKYFYNGIPLSKYCKDNDIKLIRIPYLEINNIENILIKELKIN